MYGSALTAKKPDPTELTLHEKDRPNKDDNSSIGQQKEKLRKQSA
jgi:hypothetical protein